MNLIKSIAAVTLCLSATTVLANPAFLVTHNRTSQESNAYVAGAPSPYPSKANMDNKVDWNLVKFVCWGHLVNNQCKAEIKMATNTASPISIGTVSMDIITGYITPSQLSANGYTVTVNGPGETTITKN
ncbi:MAG: hypothetical protein H0U75_10425 [Legionella sp.]|nr:hypothetical protein [Legionella sp.]